jgi:hypothetical protein
MHLYCKPMLYSAQTAAVLCCSSTPEYALRFTHLREDVR